MQLGSERVIADKGSSLGQFPSTKTEELPLPRVVKNMSPINDFMNKGKV